MHTNASDGVSDVHAVLQAAREARIDVLAITDHNTITKAVEAKQLGSLYGIEVVVGEEVSTSQGHCLAYFLTRAVRKGQTLAATIAAVHAQGGLAVIAHPYDPVAFGVLNWWRHKLTPEGLLALDFDGIEVYNACQVLPQINTNALELAAKRNTAITSGSDAHSAATVGLGITEFPGRTADDLRAALIGCSTVPTGHPWTLPQYLSLFGKRELRYASVAATYAVGLCSGAAVAAALALRSGVVRIMQ